MGKAQLFRHMMPHDIPLFVSYFYTPEGQAYNNWQFDVLVGDPDDPGAHFPANTRKAAIYQNSLKIDALGWFASTPTIIECKPNAGPGAIGQVLTYQKWYNLIWNYKPRMIIVCERMSRQIQTACMIDEIDVRIVQPANDYQIMRAMDLIKPMVKDIAVLPVFQEVS